jgi:hypothetical protein
LTPAHNQASSGQPTIPRQQLAQTHSTHSRSSAHSHSLQLARGAKQSRSAAPVIFIARLSGYRVKMNDQELLKLAGQRLLQRAQAEATALLARTDLLIAAGALIAAVAVLYLLFDTLAYAAIPSLDVPLKQEELAEELDAATYVPGKTLPKDKIPCYDPGTMQFLGYAKAMTPDEVRALLLRARVLWALCALFSQRGGAGELPVHLTSLPHVLSHMSTGACHHRQGPCGLQGAFCCGPEQKSSWAGGRRDQSLTARKKPSS